MSLNEELNFWKKFSRLIIPRSVSIQAGVLVELFIGFKSFPIKCHYANLVLSIMELPDQGLSKEKFEIGISSNYHPNSISPKKGPKVSLYHREFGFTVFLSTPEPFTYFSWAPSICKYIVTLIAGYAC